MLASCKSPSPWAASPMRVRRGDVDPVARTVSVPETTAMATEAFKRMITDLYLPEKKQPDDVPTLAPIRAVSTSRPKGAPA
jgi:hypothetical protein